MAKHVVVAIDGPAGAGKSTIARSVAERMGFVYIDTGAMYRAVAFWAQSLGIDDSEIYKLQELAEQAEITFEAGSSRVFLNGQDITDGIRTSEVSALASKVSTISGVRRVLVEKQRDLGAQISVVMEGRDIGTVVFPEATVKIYLDAPATVRAERRTNELRQRGTEASLVQMNAAIAERDRRDQTRAEAPLVQAPDAVYVNTGEMSIEEVEEAILKIIRERTANGKEYLR